MPLYEYECLECGTTFEVLQRVKDRPLKKAECDSCGCERPVRRKVSAPAFQFKGEGWYVTDYGGRKGEAREGGDSSGGGKEESSDTKGDADGKSKKKKKKDKRSKSGSGKS